MCDYHERVRADHNGSMGHDGVCSGSNNGFWRCGLRLENDGKKRERTNPPENESFLFTEQSRTHIEDREGFAFREIAAGSTINFHLTP